MQQPFNKALIKRDFNRYSDSYDQYAALQKRTAQEVAKNVYNTIPQGSHILDIGCGTGYIAQSLAKTYGITQLDIAYNMCQKAQSYAPVVNADIEAYPFAIGHFDGAVSSLSMQWATDIPQWLRVTKSSTENGVYIASIFSNNTLHQLSKSFYNTVGYSHVVHPVSSDQMLSLCKEAGYNIVCSYIVKETTYHPTLMDLLRHIKYIGAANKLPDRQQSLTRTDLQKTELYYRTHYAENGMLPADWYINHLILQSP